MADTATRVVGPGSGSTPGGSAVPGPESSRPALRVRGLVKAYGAKRGVDGVDVEVAPGEVLGFLGPNGAGKTTVLRVLMGELRPSAGVVRVLGLDPFTEAARVHDRTGFVPGDLRLPGHLTGDAFLGLCARLRRTPCPDLARLVHRFEVPLDRRIASLSKGNRQKLALVQALMSRPDLLLLDEPSSGLDPLAQEVLEDELRQAAARGSAVVLSSHVLREVEEVAHRVFMLREGRVLAVAALDELRASAPYEVSVSAAGLDVAALEALPGVAGLATHGREVVLTATAAALDGVLDLLALSRVHDLRIAPADLESLFLHYYQGG